MAAAQREVWTGAQLRRLLAEQAGLHLSAASVSALLTRQPSQVKLETLAALCTALQCTPDDESVRNFVRGVVDRSVSAGHRGWP
jgi:hypothetical protein